jgi:Fur family zinc uptake transcriptional regulator
VTKSRPSEQPARAGDSPAAELRGATREVYDLLAASERPLKAYELLWLLERKRGRPAQPPTIYRALKSLAESGHVHRVPSLGAFVVCRRSSGPHEPAFFICEVCGSVAEVDVTDIDRALRVALASRSFTARQVNLDVRGVCARCQPK